MKDYKKNETTHIFDNFEIPPKRGDLFLSQTWRFSSDLILRTILNEDGNIKIIYCFESAALTTMGQSGKITECIRDSSLNELKVF